MARKVNIHCRLWPLLLLAWAWLAAAGGGSRDSMLVLNLKGSAIELDSAAADALRSRPEGGYALLTDSRSVLLKGDEIFRVHGDTVYNDEKGLNLGKPMNPDNSYRSIFLLFDTVRAKTYARHRIATAGGDTITMETFRPIDPQHVSIELRVYCRDESKPHTTVCSIGGGTNTFNLTEIDGDIDSVVVWRSRGLTLTKWATDGGDVALQDDHWGEDRVIRLEHCGLKPGGKLTVFYDTQENYLKGVQPDDSQQVTLVVEGKGGVPWPVLAVAVLLALLMLAGWIVYKNKQRRHSNRKAREIQSAPAGEKTGLSDLQKPVDHSPEQQETEAEPRSQETETEPRQQEPEEIGDDAVQEPEDTDDKHENAIAETVKLWLEDKLPDEQTELTGDNLISLLDRALAKCEAEAGRKAQADLQPPVAEAENELKAIRNTVLKFVGNDGYDTKVGIDTATDNMLAIWLAGRPDAGKLAEEQKALNKQLAEAQTRAEAAAAKAKTAAGRTGNLERGIDQAVNSLAGALAAKGISVELGKQPDTLVGDAKKIAEAIGGIRLPEEVQGEVARMTAEISELQGRVGALDTENSGLQAQVVEAEKKLAAAASRAGLLEGDLNAERQGRKKDREEAELRRQELENQLKAEHAGELERKQSAWDDEKRQLDRRHTEAIAAKDARVKELESQVEALRDRANRERDRQIDEVRAMLTELRDELNALRQGVIDASGQDTPMMGRLNHVARDCDELYRVFETQSERWRQAAATQDNIRQGLAALLKSALEANGWANVLETLKAYSDTALLHDAMQSYGLSSARLTRAEAILRRLLGVAGIAIEVPRLLEDKYRAEDFDYDNSGSLWINNIIPGVAPKADEHTGRVIDLLQVGFSDGVTRQKPKVFYFSL